MTIYLLEIKTFYFESLLNFIPNRPEPIGDGETEKYPAHSQRMRQIADYIIDQHTANFQSYAAETGTFDKRQLGIAEASNWDYRKCKTLDLTQTDRGLKVRDGRHRCIILSVLVKTGQIAYQPIDGEITDSQKKVDVTDFRSFFEDYVTRFSDRRASVRESRTEGNGFAHGRRNAQNPRLSAEKDNDYRASLRIYFEAEELDGYDLKKTMQRYRDTTIEMLRDVPEQTKAHILPLKIVGVCQKVSKYSERVDIGERSYE